MAKLTLSTQPLISTTNDTVTLRYESNEIDGDPRTTEHVDVKINLVNNSKSIGTAFYEGFQNTGGAQVMQYGSANILKSQTKLCLKAKFDPAPIFTVERLKFVFLPSEASAEIFVNNQAIKVPAYLEGGLMAVSGRFDSAENETTLTVPELYNYDVCGQNGVIVKINTNGSALPIYNFVITMAPKTVYD